MNNAFLEYYGEHHISPVNQEIKDIGIHYERRKKLYRQCGIPTITFKDKEVLEVGPGGGYNTLAFFHWGISHADLIEPNAKGREDMEVLFTQQGVLPEKYDIFPCVIEDYFTEKKYDIIIAESFLQHLSNQQEIINKLKDLVVGDGIIVTTCTDEVCLFIERMKRMIGLSIVKNIDNYEDKVNYLVEIFGPQLKRLGGVSRPAKDWVQDTIFNPTMYNNTMSMVRVIDFFGNEYDILGSSPNIFTDYSWYKDIWVDYKEDYKSQFSEKRLTLLMANMSEIILPSQQVNNIVEHFEAIGDMAMQYEKTFDDKYLCDIRKYMNEIADVISILGKDFMKVFCDIKDAVDALQIKETIDFEQYPYFFAAFGRTQQYIAFVKK